MESSSFRDRLKKCYRNPKPPYHLGFERKDVKLLDRRPDPILGRVYEFLDVDECDPAIPYVYQSVTSYLKADDAGWLAEWRAKVGDEYADLVSHLASTRGSALHLAAEQYLLGNVVDNVSPIVLPFFLALKPYLEKVRYIWLQEAFLFSHKKKLAGTTDLLAIYDGVLSLIDYKTARQQKDITEITGYIKQCRLYVDMIFEMYGLEVPQIVILLATGDSRCTAFKINREMPEWTQTL